MRKLRLGELPRPHCLEAEEPVFWLTPEPEFLAGSYEESPIRVEAGCASGPEGPLAGTREGQQRRMSRRLLWSPVQAILLEGGQVVPFVEGRQLEALLELGEERALFCPQGPHVVTFILTFTSLPWRGSPRGQGPWLSRHICSQQMPSEG